MTYSLYIHSSFVYQSSNMFKCSLKFLLFFVFLTFQINAKSRVKRYLAFPKGSSFTATFAMTTFLPKDVVPPKIKAGYGHIIEYDFGYPFPDAVIMKSDNPKKKPKDKKKVNVFYSSPPWVQDYYSKFPDKRKWNGKRKGRILEQLSNVIDSQGGDGESCIIRLACEIQENLYWGKSLMEDVMLAMVPHPPSHQDCSILDKKCPFSILHAVLHSNMIDHTF